MNDRLVSIDIIRGITVASMIIVNNPGSWEHIYTPLSHSEWNGCTMTDMIFPFFLFIIGLSVHFSLSKSKSLNLNKTSVLFKILKRGITLFLLGLLLNGFPQFDFNHLRIMGVLQRISLVFMIAAILYLYTSKYQLYIITGILLFLYWILMCFVPVPGVGPGDLTPQHNMAAWLDSFILTGHMWEHTKTWDPEGLTSTLPAIGSVLIGVLSGMWISSSIGIVQKSRGLILGGTVFIAFGYFFGIIFPINKSLWTSSYVLYTSGFAMLFLSVVYYFFDVRKISIPVKPALALGSNAIVAYLLSELLAKIAYSFPLSIQNNIPLFIQPMLFEQLILWDLSPQNASLLMAFIWLAICFIPVWVLYNKRIFIKI